MICSFELSAWVGKPEKQPSSFACDLSDESEKKVGIPRMRGL